MARPVHLCSAVHCDTVAWLCNDIMHYRFHNASTFHLDTHLFSIDWRNYLGCAGFNVVVATVSRDKASIKNHPEGWYFWLLQKAHILPTISEL